ncbi:G-box binding factor, partial [Rhizophlyctis rosea]
YEAVLERLKNMLLVMTTQGVFQATETAPGSVNLWNVTWNKIAEFLPGLKEELFPVGASQAEGPVNRPTTVPPTAASQVVPVEMEVPSIGKVNDAEEGGASGASGAAASGDGAPVVETPVDGGSVISQVQPGEVGAAAGETA